MEAREKLLYVDDEEYNLLLFKMNFNEMFDVYTTLTPFEGLEIVKKEKIKVVVTDYKMPGMNGLELIDRIKESHPETICMVLSAYLNNEIVADKAKVFRYIVKPYQKDKLASDIYEAFKKCQLKLD
jgi:DNA-binding NtrC family response regulator